MIFSQDNPLDLLKETLISLVDAAKDFGGVAIPLETLRKYIYRGVGGIKLESVAINGRYTSKEAIQRFIDRRQNPQAAAKGKRKMLTQAEIDAGLKKYGIVDRSSLPRFLCLATIRSSNSPVVPEPDKETAFYTPCNRRT